MRKWGTCVLNLGGGQILFSPARFVFHRVVDWCCVALCGGYLNGRGGGQDFGESHQALAMFQFAWRGRLCGRMRDRTKNAHAPQTCNHMRVNSLAQFELAVAELCPTTHTNKYEYVQPKLESTCPPPA